MILLQQVTEGQLNKNKSRPRLLGRKSALAATMGYSSEGMKVEKKRGRDVFPRVKEERWILVEK
jgi:hypothetical protein